MGQANLGEAGTLGRRPATSVVAPRSRPHGEAGDASKIGSDHAVLAGSDRNRWPARHPALWRRACAPNCQSSTGDCPGSPDGTLSGGTAYSQAAGTQSAAQGDWLLKTGIERPEVPAQYPSPPRRLAEADQRVVGPLARQGKAIKELTADPCQPIVSEEAFTWWRGGRAETGEPRNASHRCAGHSICLTDADRRARPRTHPPPAPRQRDQRRSADVL